MDRLKSLATFVQVVETGGFSSAARRLNMSPTMASEHVQALEADLGARLLQRTTRKVSLTEAGQAYYENAARILGDLEEADRRIGALQSTPRGRLRLHVGTHIVRFVAPVVSEYMALYPELQVELTMGERMVDMIEEGFDLAIRATVPADSSLVIRPLSAWGMSMRQASNTAVAPLAISATAPNQSSLIVFVRPDGSVVQRRVIARTRATSPTR